MTFPWTNHQVRDLRAFVSQGITDEAIAQRLGRSVRSVRRHRYGLGILRQRKRVIRPSAPLQVENITISKAELPAFYEAGWRVEWFEAGAVGIYRVLG